MFVCVCWLRDFFSSFLACRVYSVEGFSDHPNPAKMQIVDLRQQKLHAVIDLYAMGLTVEPEFVNVHDGILYYSDARGQLIRFDFE